MTVFPNKQPSGLHLQLEPLDGLDHGLRREELAGGSTEAVQLSFGGVGAERHLLFGWSFEDAELVIVSHGERHGTYCTRYTKIKLMRLYLPLWLLFTEDESARFPQVIISYGFLEITTYFFR